MSLVHKIFTTEKYEISYQIESDDDGLRLDQFVQKCMPTLSRQFLKKKIDKGDITIQGRTSPHKPSVKIHTNDIVTIVTKNDGLLEEELWRGKSVPKDQAPEIIFENQELIVINKPPFMITHPAGKNLFYCATVFFETIYQKTIHSIHRLDRETSGILLLGKDPVLASKIGLLFENEKVYKAYFLIAHRNDKSTTLPFSAYERMGREENSIPRGIMSIYSPDSSQGKDALTHFELLDEFDNYVFLMAFPETGRQHQIRVHAQHHGYPLLGDKLYCGDVQVFIRFKDHMATEDDHTLMQIPRQALHAMGLSLNHQEAKIPKLFTAPLPNDLKQWIKQNTKIDCDLLEKKAIDKIMAKFNSF